jgi:hypothetical protein
MILTNHRIAGLNLARLLQTLRCDQKNFTFCVLPAYMIVVGEMSVGVIVACVPTFGPVFFPSRVRKNTGYRKPTSVEKLTQSFGRSSNRKQLSLFTSDTVDDGSFHALNDNDIELERALNVGHGYKASASHGSTHTEDDEVRSMAPNGIGVRKDLSVEDTAMVS